MIHESTFEPRDHAERVAIFRYGVISSMLTRDLAHGDLASMLRSISAQPHRPPNASCTRRYSVTTLERWVYRYKRGGLDALRPNARADRGRGRDLTAEARELLLEIRRENPSASVPLILQTLQVDGRIDPSTISASTLRRLYHQEGLPLVASEHAEHAQKTRLRWQTLRPDALWHGDVCHGPTLVVAKRGIPTRIHALLDDHSRYVVALRVYSTEQEVDMLDLFINALRIYGKPDGLYLDNGPTYRGDALQVLCARLGISLLHAKPYDPQARGKMERFWLTMRRQVLDYCENAESLSALQTRLNAWLDRHYHATSHGSLFGKTPATVYLPEAREMERVDDTVLRDALRVTETRKVRKDTTVSIDGRIYELDQGWLAGREINVHWSALDNPIQPWAEYEEKRFELYLVNPEANSTRKRPTRQERPETKPKRSLSFDPSHAPNNDTTAKEVTP